MATERTFSIIKPDATERNITGKIITKFEEAGLRIVAQKRIRMTREQATALAARGSELVDAGRPPCPLCDYPLDPRGHVCPKTNGHHPPRL